MRNKKSSLNGKTWLYLVIFSLSVVLLFQFFQIILFESFYKNTCKNQVIELNNEIKNIFFSSIDDKDNQIKNLTASANACVLIINTDDNSTTGYDSLGQSCALYTGKSVNETLVEQTSNSKEDTIFFSGKYNESSNRSIMIYGQKLTNNNQKYLILSNIELSSTDNIKKTFTNQTAVITIIILVLSFIIAFGLSNIVSQPIVNLTKEATKLKKGEFDIKVEDSNIIEIDELNTTIVQAGEELKRVEVLRKELLSNVSHDLRTPLTMIKAYAEMIKDISGENKEKRDQHLDVIINETDNLDMLVSNVLDLTKLQDGVLKLDKEPFDMTSLMNQCVNNFKALANKEGVEIDLICDLELIAIGDKTRIYEVVNNFISNAIKHGVDGKKIVVKAILTNKKRIYVEITDFGHGISENDIPYIWDRYYKTNKQYKRASSGSGLGLAINKAILQQHNSDFGVKSKINEYTTFYFDLPSKSLD